MSCFECLKEHQAGPNSTAVRFNVSTTVRLSAQAHHIDKIMPPCVTNNPKVRVTTGQEKILKTEKMLKKYPVGKKIGELKNFEKIRGKLEN